MCGRTSLFVPPSVLEERFDADIQGEFVPRYNIAPREDLWVLANEQPGSIRPHQWGLLPSFVDDPADSPRPINARAESVAEKPYFRGAFTDRRCLVLADGFYEWAGERGSKQPYRIQRTDERPFAFAGLWEQRETDDGTHRSVTIITTDANEVVAGIHNRMPVILEADEEGTWLKAADPDTHRGLLDPVEGDRLQAYPITTAINDPSNESPSVIERASTEQSGFEEFT